MRQSSLILSVALLFLISSVNADDTPTKGHLIKPKAAKIYKPTRNPESPKAFNINVDKTMTDAHRVRREALRKAVRNLPAVEASTSTGGCPNKVSTKASTSPAC